MALPFASEMDALYLACVVVDRRPAVLISAGDPVGRCSRAKLLNALRLGPQPTAVLLTIVLTFFGAPRLPSAPAHNVSLVVIRCRRHNRRVTDFVV